LLIPQNLLAGLLSRKGIKIRPHQNPQNWKDFRAACIINRVDVKLTRPPCFVTEPDVGAGPKEAAVSSGAETKGSRLWDG